MQQLLERLREVAAEQNRRKNSPLARYNAEKVHKKQMAFHKCTKRNRWVFGGNRSGKTECGAVETVWLSRGIHPFRTNRKSTSCWVVSLSQQVQRDVAQQKILYYLNPAWIRQIVMISGSKRSPAHGVIDYIEIENVFGGTSKIAFKSCEAGREKFQGTSLDFVWFDEEPPQDIYEECRMRVLDRRGEIFGTMTPLKGLTWVYEEIYQNAKNNPEVWCEFMEWGDNPYLSAEEIAEMSQSLSADSLDARRFGRFQSLGGMVYTEFSEANVIEPFSVPLEWQDKLSIDPGLSNPLSCHWYARDYDGNVYVVAEWYAAKQSVEYHAQKIREISSRLNWRADKFGRYEALIDSAANQRTLNGQRSVAELFAEHGITVNPRVNKDLYTGISKVKSLLKPASGPPKLYIFSCCTNMIREIKGYFWGNGDVPVKRDDHAMDELRYYVCSLSDVTELKPVKSAITLDKERLARRNSVSRRL
ncbi:MAG: terminase family protein [Corallococcus sp.]|nr:terminase family protein [Corallococcus sp.]MCM1359667.1 terminase family protein [Corallococcus sp.]MCM1395376.1 terminase family protein [Corallococcus sp.]